MERTYKLGDEITATNGKIGYGTGQIFTGTVIGFHTSGYIINYEYGWTLDIDRQQNSSWEIDSKYIDTTMWHVAIDEIRELQIPSNKLMSKIADTAPSANGNHAQCYPHPTNRKKILLATNCPARKVMAKGKFPNNPYFPRPRAVGKLGKIEVYELEKYLPVDITKLSKLDKKIYIGISKKCSYSFEALKNNKHIPKHITKLILQAKNVLCKEGWEPAFDNCDHNMMMTQSGQLVFTDLFWVGKEQYKRR